MKKSEYTEQYYKHLYQKLNEHAYLLEKMLNKKKIDMAKKKASKKLDPIDKEDEDIDNDGKPNTKTDKYLKNRRAAIKKAMAKKKQVVKEGTIVTDGKLFYGGFPMLKENKKYSEVGTAEMMKILGGGGHPVMSDQTENGIRGVPDNIRKEAISHLEKVKSHPQGPIQNYSRDHQIYKEGKAAHDFFKKHFNAFGVDEELADRYDIDRI